MIKELGSRIHLIGEFAVGEFDKLINEVTLPFGTSGQPDALADDESGMPAEPRGFGATVGVDRYDELAELAEEFGNERRSVGGARDRLKVSGFSSAAT